MYAGHSVAEGQTDNRLMLYAFCYRHSLHNSYFVTLQFTVVSAMSVSYL